MGVGHPGVDPGSTLGSRMTLVYYELVIIVVLVVVNGIFAMSEVALLSARRNRLQHLAERGNKNAQRALDLLQDPNNFLSTVQIGVTLVGVLSGAFGGATLAAHLSRHLRGYPAIAPYADTISISIIVLAITYLSLIIGELVPKRVALHSPERIASAVAEPMSIISRLGSPLVGLLSASTNAVLWVFRIKDSREPMVTQDDVRSLIRMGARTGVFKKDEQQIVERVFRLSNRRVSAIMTHRADIVWLDINDPPDVLVKAIRQIRYLRVPVCDGDLDRTLGILSAKDFFAAVENTDIRTMLKPAVYVPEGMPALKVLEQFRTSTASIALVIDEYGSVQGLVSAIDLLEALVGDLPGEKRVDHPVMARADGSWLVDGALPLEDLKELLRVDSLPDESSGRFHTAAGFLIYHLGRIPKAADAFDFDSVHMEVVDMDGNRVDKLLVASAAPKQFPGPRLT